VVQILRDKFPEVVAMWQHKMDGLQAVIYERLRRMLAASPLSTQDTSRGSGQMAATIGSDVRVTKATSVSPSSFPVIL
jgi:hypothetical protein